MSTTEGFSQASLPMISGSMAPARRVDPKGMFLASVERCESVESQGHQVEESGCVARINAGLVALQHANTSRLKAGQWSMASARSLESIRCLCGRRDQVSRSVKRENL
jgi:hypothetical protein